MSKFIIISADMHKVAEFTVDIKYRRPGNVVEYLPVKFEVFKDGEFFRAVPLPAAEVTKLVNLQSQYLFQLKNGKVCNCKEGSREVLDNIVGKMVQTYIPELSATKIAQGSSNRNSYSAQY